jgi:cell division transport system permease protein
MWEKPNLGILEDKALIGLVLVAVLGIGILITG